ncbi:flagellar basal body P-ring formation chaperone FlgA [Undibacterium luofuense]|uniref:flagellar basal body P-ring formation chaperone FlgA n=1 Tax=Undibacterium luofuense TaxID=2828733 RepID=UPI0030EB3056
MRSFCLLLLTLLTCAQASAQNAVTQTAPARQDPALAKHVASEFLKEVTSSLPGEVRIQIADLDTRQNLAACDELRAFMPPGAKTIGKTNVGLRCSAPKNWQIYLGAQIQVFTEYLVAAHPLTAGQTVTLADISKVRGDISVLPSGYMLSEEQASGKTMGTSIQAGTPLRADQLRNAIVIQQGQAVRIQAGGNGFRITTDGQALNNAADGQTARAKLNNGQTVSGIARAGGIIEIAY